MRRYYPLYLLVSLLGLAGLSCQLAGAVQPTAPSDDGGWMMFSPPDLPGGKLGEAYEIRIEIENVRTAIDEINVSKGSLPPGLMLERVAGEDAVMISGEPTEAGAFTFTLNILCLGTNIQGQIGAHVYTIVIEPGP